MLKEKATHHSSLSGPSLGGLSPSDKCQSSKESQGPQGHQGPHDPDSHTYGYMNKNRVTRLWILKRVAQESRYLVKNTHSYYREQDTLGYKNALLTKDNTTQDTTL